MAHRFLANVRRVRAVSVIASKSAICLLALGSAAAGMPARADPHICIGAMTDVEVLFRVRNDAYFSGKPLDGRTLRLEYDGCGYRVHVGESSRNARDGDLLLVDRFGRVTRIVQRR